MLATAQDMHHAMNLSPADIQQALVNSGYEQDSVLAARFRGFNGTSFVYSITYRDIDGANGDAQLYVRLGQCNVTKKLAFTAEY